MMVIPELLFELGAWSVEALWIPLLVWTGFAIPVYAVLRFAEGTSPQVRYTGMLALLASLPLGMVTSWLALWSPPAIGNAAVVVLPSISYAPAPALAEAAFTWTAYHSAGVAVLLMGALAICRGVSLAVAFAGLRRYRTRTCLPAPTWLERLVGELGRRTGNRRHVDVVVSQDRVSPLTFGWKRPLVVVPALLLESDDDLELALIHELTHVRRRDYVLQWLEHLIGAVFLIHPLVALLRHETSVLREITCDADVLAILEKRSRYARMLFHYSASADERWSVAVGILIREHHLKKRIQAMKQFLDFNEVNRSKRIGSVVSGLLLLLAVVAVACSDAIVHPTASEDANPGARAPGVYVVVEDMPELVGGLESIQKNLEYPALAKEAGVEGRVIVQFTVDEEGTVRDAEVVRGVGSGLDEAALEAVRTARFRPGKQRGEAVKVRMSLPVTFKLGPDSAGRKAAPSSENRDSIRVDGQRFSRDAIEDSMRRLGQRYTNTDVYEVVEEMPQLQGGLASLQRDLKYPELAREAGIEGRVIVQFVVDQNGDVRDVELVRGIGGGADEEAMRVVRNARFTPGRDRGEPVSVRMALPFTFKLPSSGVRSDVIRVSINDSNQILVNNESVPLSEVGTRVRAAGVTEATIITLVVSGRASMDIVTDVQEELRRTDARRIEYSRTP